MADYPELATLILAAGESRRLGTPKQLVQLGQESLLQRSVRLAQAAAAGPVHVVLGAQAARCREELQGTAATSHINPDWSAGMGGSLALGVERVARERQVRAVMLLHVDQYQLEISELSRLVRAWQESPERVAVAVYAGTVGPPVIFPRPLFPALQACSGEHGARTLLLRQDARRVAMPAAEFDLDSPADLEALKIFSARLA